MTDLHNWPQCDGLLGIDAPPCPLRIWRVDLASGSNQAMPSNKVLNAEEHARACRFATSDLRRRFTAARVALKMILASVLGTTPRRLRLDNTEYGRPFVASPQAPAFDFNLSHAGDVAVIALSAGARVGVDIELRSRPGIAFEDFRDHMTNAEIAQIKRLPADRLHLSLLRLWTRKEAFVKADGRGLSRPLSRFSVPVSELTAPLTTRPDGREPWTFWDLSDDEAIISVIRGGSECRLQTAVLRKSNFLRFD